MIQQCLILALFMGIETNSQFFIGAGVKKGNDMVQPALWILERLSVSGQPERLRHA